MTFKRLISYVLALVMGVNCALAVLPENNVDLTVQMLLKDLEVLKSDIEFQKDQYESTRNEFWEETTRLEDELDKAALVLHTQNENWLFGMAQASHIAHETIDKFKNRRTLIENWFERVNSSHDGILAVRRQLEEINKANLSVQGLKCLNQSIEICNDIESSYQEYMELIAPDKARYLALEQRVSDLDESTHKTLNDLYTYIFVKGNEPFGSVFDHYSERSAAMSHDYSNSFDKGQTYEDHWSSDEEATWDGITSLCSLLISITLFIVLQRKKDWGVFNQYASTWGMMAFFLLNIVADIITIICLNLPSYVTKEVVIYMQFDLFAALILASRIINRSKVKLRYIVLLYTPLLMMTYMFISFISKLVPLSLIVTTLPIFYILFIVTQLIILVCIRRKIDKPQRNTNLANTLLVAVCLVVAWNGWSVASMIIFLTWISLWGIVLIVYLLKKLIDWKVSKHNSPLLVYTMRWLVNPMLLIFAFVGSSYWVSSLFNLTSWYMEWMLMPFVNLPNVCVISLAKLLSVIQLGLIVNYVLNITKRLLVKSNSEKYGSGKAAVAISMASIVVWLGYAIAVIIILQINHNGIIAAIGGASLGLGFAMRDTFENFFYGLTMMAGRARPGDIVECDGIRGHIKDVGIISTSIETEDGPIVSLPNRQLFGRNFSNLTLNNRREIRHIIFDISQNNDIEKAREIMLEAAKGIDGVVNLENHYVVMKHTSCGVVRLDYKCWIDSERYLRTEPAVREAIFMAFKENGIEMAELLQTLDLKASSSIMNDKLLQRGQDIL